MNLLHNLGVLFHRMYAALETILTLKVYNQQQEVMASVYEYCSRLAGKPPLEAQIEDSSQAKDEDMPRAKSVDVSEITHAIPINVLHVKQCQFCCRNFSYLQGLDKESCGAPLQFKCGHVSCRDCIERGIRSGTSSCGSCATTWEPPTFDIPSPRIRKGAFRDISEAHRLEEAIEGSEFDDGEQCLIYLRRDNRTYCPEALTLRYRTTVIKALTIAQTLAADADYKPVDPNYSHSLNGCIFYPDKNKSLSPVPNNGAYKIGIAAFIYFNALIPNTLSPPFKKSQDTELWMRAVWYALERIPSTYFDTHQEIINELSYGTWCAFRKITGVEPAREGDDMEVVKLVLGRSLQLAAELGSGFQECVPWEFRREPDVWLELFGGVKGEGY
jgi:hypothetical protein